MACGTCFGDPDFARRYAPSGLPLPRQTEVDNPVYDGQHKGAHKADKCLFYMLGRTSSKPWVCLAGQVSTQHLSYNDLPQNGKRLRVSVKFVGSLTKNKPRRGNTNSQGRKPLDQNPHRPSESRGGAAVAMSPLRGLLCWYNLTVPGAYASGYLVPPLRGYFSPTIKTLTQRLPGFAPPIDFWTRLAILIRMI